MTKLISSDYIGNPVDCRQGQKFDAWNRRGYTCIEVLPFLKNKPWDEVALGFVHSLRPTQLRVVQDGIQLDSQTWRVTVWLKSDKKTIKRIEQEVEVGLPDECANGAALEEALHSGLTSKQVKWHKISGTECFDCISKPPRRYKLTNDGKTIPYPTK